MNFCEIISNDLLKSKYVVLTIHEILYINLHTVGGGETMKFAWHDLFFAHLVLSVHCSII